MFVLSIKPNHKKIIGIAALVLALVVGVFVWSSSRDGGEWSVTASGKKYTLKASTNEERIAFLQQFGWTVNPEPLEITEVTIPSVFNEVYERYNELQKSQGLDLSRYAGKICKQWVYEVTNYPAQDTTVRATLLVLDGRVIGGDLSSPALDGFMSGFVGQTSDGDSPDSQNVEAEETLNLLEDPQSSAVSSEIPATAWPTD